MADGHGSAAQAADRKLFSVGVRARWSPFFTWRSGELLGHGHLRRHSSGAD